MKRLYITIACASAFSGVLGGCDFEIAKDCERLGYSPSSNSFDLRYDVKLPDKCPVALANPGTETKYAGAQLYDYGLNDFDQGAAIVYSSTGEMVGDERVRFHYIPTPLTDGTHWRAAPTAEYTAATGTKQVSDYDIAEFSAWRNGVRRAWGNIKITYRQSSVSTKLTGERIPTPGSTYTWDAPTTGGSPGYMYQWYRNGAPVGNGSSYTASAGSSAFDLRVEVTDQTWSTVAAVLMVNVGGVEASVSGPSLVYSSSGGGSWSATGRGGTGAYTFEWYLDGVYVGSGPAWGGYPGENSHTLRVDMGDSAGATDSQSFFVTGIGSGTGSCEPVPPALAC
jgi:hypothetical protein